MTENGKQIGEWFTVGLNGTYNLSSIKVWNLNETSRGTQMADIYVSMTGVGSPISNPSAWTKVKEDQTFNRALYADGYTAADTVTFSPSVQARYVSFVVEHYYGNGGVDVGDSWGQTHAGFSEIQFFGTAVASGVISGVTATASSTETWNGNGTPNFDRSPSHAVNGDGLSSGLHDKFVYNDSTHNHNDWCTAGVTPGDQWFKADLQSKKNLDSMQIWNCNESGFTTRGVQQFDVYVSDTGTGTPTSDPGEWTLARENVTITQGTGSDGLGRSGLFDLTGYSGRYVLIDVDSNHGDVDRVSIAEVQFFEKASPNGVLQFSSATYSDTEGNDGTKTVTITVKRTGGSVGAVGVTYATSDGTATQPGDYVTASGTLSWSDGDSADKTFTVTVNGDTTHEPEETVNLTLSDATGGATLGAQSTATLTILDDDHATTVIIDNGDAGFTHSGLGTSFSSDSRGYGDTGLGTPATSGGEMAQWAFSGLTANTWYDVLYHPFEYNEAQATFSGPVFEITAGAGPTLTVDTNPGNNGMWNANPDRRAGARNWAFQTLASVKTDAAGTITLRMPDVGRRVLGWIIADAAMVVKSEVGSFRMVDVADKPAASTGIVNGGNAFWSNPDGKFSLPYDDANAHSGRALWQNSQAANALYTFSYLVPGATYNVYAAWPGRGDFASNVPLTFSGNVVGTPGFTINQTSAPAHDTQFDGTWCQLLGTVTADNSGASVVATLAAPAAIATADAVVLQLSALPAASGTVFMFR
jgi:hypothetical protein